MFNQLPPWPQQQLSLKTDCTQQRMEGMLVPLVLLIGMYHGVGSLCEQKHLSWLINATSCPVHQ
jgi:hypothetical protein